MLASKFYRWRSHCKKSTFQTLTKNPYSLLTPRKNSNPKASQNGTEKFITWSSYLLGCKDINTLQQIHGTIIIDGSHNNVIMVTKLLALYTSLGYVENAYQLFQSIPFNSRDVYLYNVMIKSCIVNGNYEKCINLYFSMRNPDNYSVTLALKACTATQDVRLGKMVHNHVVKFGLESDTYVVNCLIAMYARCGFPGVARQLFDKMPTRDVISWNSLVVAYLQNGQAYDALKVFDNIRRDSDVLADSVTVIGALQAVCDLECLDIGKRLHCFAVHKGFDYTREVANSLIAMYSKCGEMGDAFRLFDTMWEKDVVSWNAIISGYAQNGHGYEALRVFCAMQKENVFASMASVVSLLQACAQLTAFEQGKSLHAYVVRRDFEFDIVLATALIDMYTKCGDVVSARNVFDRMPTRNVVSWNALIAGYGIHGLGEDAVVLFQKMKDEEVDPNAVTFLSVLSACSHSGLVDQGLECFESMVSKYSVTPKMEHYACAVDLLGRAGHLQEAYDFICQMPLQPDVRVWGALLSACRTYGDADLADKVATHLFTLRPNEPGCYVLLYNIYSAATRWDDAEKVRHLMKEKGLDMSLGNSCVDHSGIASKIPVC